jgi:hypothetical protein
LKFIILGTAKRLQYRYRSISSEALKESHGNQSKNLWLNLKSLSNSTTNVGRKIKNI